MGMLLIASHRVLEFACRSALQRYQQQAFQLELVQRRKLKHLVQRHTGLRLSYEQFTQKYPLTCYADWKNDIEKSRSLGRNYLSSEKVIHFQPARDSTEALKFIPYTQTFFEELDQAIGLWLGRLYRQYPQLRNSTHYWPVSWPSESQRKLLENDHGNDSSASLTVSKRMLSKITQSVPAEVAMSKSAEDAMFATAAYLAADKKLGIISVWSPAFALQLFDLIEQNQQELSETLRNGKWQRDSLNFLKAPKSCEQSYKLRSLDFQSPDAWAALWPKLTLISSWEAANAAQWAVQLQNRAAGVNFECKGLWAAEGVVTVPFAGSYALSYQSHFYEFLRKDSEQPVPCWELKQGDVVSPVLTTGSGLMRYVLEDELEVTGFYKQVPCFKFLGRKVTVDLAGEKMDRNAAMNVLSQFKCGDYLPVSLLGIEHCPVKKSHYILLSEGNGEHQPSPEQLDQQLKQNFHYELARNLGQLDEPEIKHVDNAERYYQTLALHNGLIESNLQPEPLQKMKTKID
ncbi:GH3 auxin-responsive promoter family protein [Acinetobacter sp.]|uniref:GH3 family domain-containing protein n=1 Tax=Acinetobacter sp. TaxID=472 RepID=UPI0035AE10DC